MRYLNIIKYFSYINNLCVFKSKYFENNCNNIWKPRRKMKILVKSCFWKFQQNSLARNLQMS